MILELNGKVLDFEGKIAITRQAFDVNDWDVRLLDITNSIILSNSTNNKNILPCIDTLDSTVLDTSFNCKIIEGFYVFNGIGFINQTGDVKKLQLIDASKTFFDTLNTQLNTIALNSDDFVYDINSYSLLNEFTDSIWIWPVVQMYDAPWFNAAADTLYLRPHLNYYNVLKRIFNEGGYTLNLDTDLIQKLAVQVNSNEFYFTTYQKTLTGSAFGDLNTFVYKSDSVTVFSSTQLTFVIPTAFRLRGWVTAAVDSTLYIANEANDVIKFKAGRSYYDETTSTGNYTNISLVGDVIFEDVDFFTIIKESTIKTIDDWQTDFLVKASENIPKMTKKELLNQALLLTASVFEPDNINKIINVRSLGNINFLNMVDWSEKYVNDSATIRNDIAKLSIRNNLTYANGIGDHYFLTNIPYLQNEGDYIKSKFAGAIDAEHNAIYNTYKNSTEGLFIRNENEGIHICYVEEYNGYNVGVFEPLKWQNLYTNYYKYYLNSLKNPREVEAYFNLTQLDVIGFNPIQLIYIEQYNASFIIQNISQYRKGELTKVKMLQIKTH